MTLPQQDAVEEQRRRDRTGGYSSSGPASELRPPPSGPAPGGQHDLRHGIDPRVFDPAREPYGDVDPETGEILRDPAAIDRRVYGPGRDIRTVAWPPPSKGPVPPRDALPDDFNIFTAQDEIDAWAHEHNDATNRLARLRRELAGDPDNDGVEIEVMRARARYRRIARANPTERGRRTSADIDSEVDEKLAGDAAYRRKLDLEASVSIQMDRLFRARDNISRLDSYVRSLPRVSDRP